MLYQLSYTGKNEGAYCASGRYAAHARLLNERAQSQSAAPTAHAHDDVHAGPLRAGRQRRVDVQRNRLERDVGELAGVDVIEMMMRARRRIVELARRIDVDRPQQALVAEQVQRVVDGRL